MIYCFDLDGVLCTTTKNQEYYKAEPIREVIEIVNILFNQGHYIKIYTARGMTSNKDFRLLTKLQLAEWGIEYNELIMNKPSADLYIDDKGINIKDFKNEYCIH